MSVGVRVAVLFVISAALAAWLVIATSASPQAATRQAPLPCASQFSERNAAWRESLAQDAGVAEPPTDEAYWIARDQEMGRQNRLPLQALLELPDEDFKAAVLRRFDLKLSETGRKSLTPAER